MLDRGWPEPSLVPTPFFAFPRLSFPNPSFHHCLCWSFIFAVEDGCTRDLLPSPVREPGARLKAGADDRYTSLPDSSRYENLVLGAGESDATFAFASTVHLVKRLDANSKIMIWFVWVIGEQCKSPPSTSTFHRPTIRNSAAVLVYEHVAVLASSQSGHVRHPICQRAQTPRIPFFC